MTIDPNYWLWHRYYQIPPEAKTLDDCRNHGADHKGYGWSPQIDPRWTDDQKAAYLDGWNSTDRPSTR